ncbi:MAG TPA: sigma 54-interacting transcriptional regulator [Gemmataceae bacterium]|jgi:transcriptional regulator with GAF, ATPase, and Fis domain|nr:sigma 54-interacting transcriptional regulator [Gemmataceae bacterium]
MANPNWRRWIVILATLAISAYSVGVFWYVLQSPDIGIHCTFSRKVGRIYPAYVRSSMDDSFDQYTGYKVAKLGPTDIESFPQYLRTIRQLAQHVEEGRPPSEGVVTEDGETRVRVVLVGPRSDPPVTLWCVLGRTPLESMVPSGLWIILEVGMFVVGALVFWKRPGDRAAGPFFALSIMAVGAFVGGYHWWQIITQPVLLTLFVIAAVLVPPVTLHFYHVFPRPKSWMIRRPRLVLAAIYTTSIVMGIAILGAYFWVRWLFRAGEAAENIRHALAWNRILILGSFSLSSLQFLAGVLCLFHSLRSNQEPSEKQQVKWILAGSLLALAPIGYSLFLAIFAPLEFVSGGAIWPMFFASACITVAFTISITRYRLLRLDLFLDSGVVYFLISFLGGLAYYLLVFTGMLLVGRQVIPGPSLGQVFWVSCTFLVLLVILDAIRGRFQKSLENHFRRDKHQLDRTLHQLSEAIEHLVEPPVLVRYLLDACTELLSVSQGSFFLAEEDPPMYRLAGAIGSAPALVELAPASALVSALERQTLLTLQNCRDSGACDQLQNLGGEIALSLRYEDRLLGFLVLGPKASGFFTGEDFHLLTAFSSISALALQSAAGRHAIVGLNRDLQAKVEKISEQQGRIVALQRQLVRQQSNGDGKAEEKAAASSPRHKRESEIVGSSLAVVELLDTGRKVAASLSAVLIRGESGTGKELLAEDIHKRSARADKPFIKVHCAALSPTLLESELFGHVKGAFTGAVSDKVGRFELANGGTLFLDEIGDISLEVQTKLLRVLQEKMFERVGSSESIRVDVRIVAATHQNLERLIQQERFREDLFYRLNVIPLTVPPLRDRREDIPELVQFFLQQFGQQLARPALEIEDEAMIAIQHYKWPGNIRQLRNVLERAIVVCDGPTISLSDLPEEVRANQNLASGLFAAPALRTVHTGAHKKQSRRAAREERMRQEREALVRVLGETQGNKAEAARVLGIPRSTLLSRMQKYGLQ